MRSFLRRVVDAAKAPYEEPIRDVGRPQLGVSNRERWINSRIALIKAKSLMRCRTKNRIRALVRTHAKYRRKIPPHRHGNKGYPRLLGINAPAQIQENHNYGVSGAFFRPGSPGFALRALSNIHKGWEVVALLPLRPTPRR